MGVAGGRVRQQQQVHPRGGHGEGERPGDHAHLHSILGQLGHYCCHYDIKEHLPVYTHILLFFHIFEKEDEININK